MSQDYNVATVYQYPQPASQSYSKNYASDPRNGCKSLVDVMILRKYLERANISLVDEK